jgi:hypothetical protein
MISSVYAGTSELLDERLLLKAAQSLDSTQDVGIREMNFARPIGVQYRRGKQVYVRHVVGQEFLQPEYLFARLT